MDDSTLLPLFIQTSLQSSRRESSVVPSSLTCQSLLPSMVPAPRSDGTWAATSSTIWSDCTSASSDSSAAFKLDGTTVHWKSGESPMLASCQDCARFQCDPDDSTSAQLKLVCRNLRPRRGRLKIGSRFLATPPDAEGSESDEKEYEYLLKVSTASTSGPPAPDLNEVEVSATAIRPIIQEAAIETGTLQTVLTDELSRLLIAAAQVTGDARHLSICTS